MSEDLSASPEDDVPPMPEVKPPTYSEADKANAKKLWERLAKSRPGPDKKDLMYLARFVPLLSSSASKTLLNKKLTLDELKELIQYVPKARDAAAKQALKLGGDVLTEDDLRFLFSQTKSVDVGRYLLKKYPNDANMGLVERTTGELKEIVTELRARETTKEVMKEIDRKL